jgi:hypothetical protein
MGEWLKRAWKNTVYKLLFAVRSGLPVTSQMTILRFMKIALIMFALALIYVIL